MNDLKNKILVSKRDFDSKDSLRKHYTREEFKFIEYVRVDSKLKYALITPLKKKRNKDCKLLFHLNSLSSHFYLKSA